MPCYDYLHAREVGRQRWEETPWDKSCSPSLSSVWGQGWRARPALAEPTPAHGYGSCCCTGTQGQAGHPLGCLLTHLQSYYKPWVVSLVGQDGKPPSFYCSTQRCCQVTWCTLSLEQLTVPNPSGISRKCPLDRKSSPALHKLLHFGTVSSKPNEAAAACPSNLSPGKQPPAPRTALSPQCGIPQVNAISVQSVAGKRNRDGNFLYLVPGEAAQGNSAAHRLYLHTDSPAHRALPFSHTDEAKTVILLNFISWITKNQ